MSPNSKRIVAGLLLTILPIASVFWAKQSTWGTFVATPKARQKGAEKAPVLMVEYSDFQCPMCARVQPDLRTYLERYDGKVRLAFKYFPLSTIHRNAVSAAHAAECAAEQNLFWPYQDKLFEQQAEWSPLTDPTTSYRAIAQAVPLDMGRFEACYADPAKRQVIEQDRKDGAARQITSTPTLFIGDERLVGTMIQTDGARMIERELRK